MNTNSKIGRLASILFATAAMAFALSATAGPTKKYSFYLVDKSTLDANNAVNIPATQWVQVKNEAPPSTANSNISSFKFSLANLAIVSVVRCGTVTSSGFVAKGTCVLDPNSPNTVLVTNISPPIQATNTYTVEFTVASCGAGNIPADSIKVYSGSQFTGDTFQPSTLSLTTDISCGNASCDVPFETYVYTTTLDGVVNCDNSPTAETCIKGIRGLNSDGTCSNAALSYFINNYLPTTANNLNFRWSTSSQPTAVFAYKVNVATTSTSEPTWIVSWLSDGAKPAFIDAQDCVGKIPFPADADAADALPLPFEYGKLAKNVASSTAGTTMTIKVDATSQPDDNEIFVIQHERLKFLSATSGGNWSVVRGQNQTSGTPVPSYAKNLSVMFTPMPTIHGDAGPTDNSDPTVRYFDSDTDTYVVGANPGYTTGLKAKMCKASDGHDNDDGTWSVWLIDGGDGFGGSR